MVKQGDFIFADTSEDLEGCGIVFIMIQLILFMLVIIPLYIKQEKEIAILSLFI